MPLLHPCCSHQLENHFYLWIMILCHQGRPWDFFRSPPRGALCGPSACGWNGMRQLDAGISSSNAQWEPSCFRYAPEVRQNPWNKMMAGRRKNSSPSKTRYYPFQGPTVKLRGRNPHLFLVARCVSTPPRLVGIDLILPPGADGR